MLTGYFGKEILSLACAFRQLEAIARIIKMPEGNLHRFDIRFILRPFFDRDFPVPTEVRHPQLSAIELVDQVMIDEQLQPRIHFTDLTLGRQRINRQ